jgi:hypothetical protein
MTLELREYLRGQPLPALYNFGDRQFGITGWTPPAFLPTSLIGRRRETCRLDYLLLTSVNARFTSMALISCKTSRSKLIETIEELAPETIAMEACASAHYWGRWFVAAGHPVLLINPRFVKPFVKGSKNDAADSEGIYEAAMRPTMRFLPVKSVEHQDLQSLHRARDLIVCTRTDLIKALSRC